MLSLKPCWRDSLQLPFNEARIYDANPKCTPEGTESLGVFGVLASDSACSLVGADAVEAQCKRFEVSSSEDGRVLFSADEEEIVIGADRLKVTGR